jgi:hypothetical protein
MVTLGPWEIHGGVGVLCLRQASIFGIHGVPGALIDAVLILMQGGCVAAHLHGHPVLNDEGKWGCKIGRFVSLSLLPFSCSIFVPE